MKLAPLSAVQPTEIEKAWAALEKCCRDIVPTRIVGEADHADARNLIDDLETLAKRVDALVLAYGEYAVGHFGPQRIDISMFTEQLSGALEGNALYELNEAGRDIEQERRDHAEENAAEMRRDMQAAE